MRIRSRPPLLVFFKDFKAFLTSLQEKYLRTYNTHTIVNWKKSAKCYWRLRKIPNTWKLANVTPLHKKWPKQQVTNYRPISLTSIICKSMAKFAKDSLMNHMESNQLFTNDQHGLRKERSCITQLIEVMENISITTTM